MILRYFISTTLLFLSLISSAFAAGEESTLDLDRFQLEAQAEMQKLFPSEKMNFQRAMVLFRDGAAQLEAPEIEDLAAIVYVLPLNEGTLPNKKFRLGYRLWLNGKTDMPLVEYPIYDDPEDSGITFRSADRGTAQLQSFATEKDAKALIAALRKIAPEGVFEFHFAKNQLTFRVAPHLATRIVTALQSSTLVRRASMDLETYGAPVELALPERITKTGKIDLDRYRSLTEDLRDRGRAFSSTTKVPERLR